MKYIRLMLISIAVFFSLACIVSFFIPAQFRILRMTNIAYGQDTVLNQVKDLAQWKNWFPGLDNIQLKNPEYRAGKMVKATSDEVTISIKEETDSNTVVAVIEKRGRPIIYGWQIDKDPRKDSLALQTYIDIRLNWYPWEKFSSLMLDKGYGDMLTQSLNNLKNLKGL